MVGPQNILDYWTAVEIFDPPKIETEKKTGYLQSIQSIVRGNKSISWQTDGKVKFKHKQGYTWIFTIFLGGVKIADIADEFIRVLGVEEPARQKKDQAGVSCLCSFQINSFGKTIKDSFTIPDYFPALSCLHNSNNKPPEKSDIRKIQKKFKDAYLNTDDYIVNRQDDNIWMLEDLEELLADIIDLSKLPLGPLISNVAIIHGSQVPIPRSKTNEWQKNKGNLSEEELKQKYHEFINEFKISDTITNSYYKSDISLVAGEFKKNRQLNKCLQEYLSPKAPSDKKDFRANKEYIKEYSNYNYLPLARWPSNPKHALSVAQQISVNLALREDKGLFSINGPPGTGKSTLLRDIIAGVTLDKAKALAKFEAPQEAFKESEIIHLEKYKYKAWHLDESLLGKEIVIASTNNNAVENISKELPRQDEIYSKYQLDYFSEIASYVLGEDAWGLCSAVLGNKSNCSKFFDKFWTKTPDKKAVDKNKLNNDYGLDYLLNELQPSQDWQEARSNFLNSLEKCHQHIDALKQYEEAKRKLPQIAQQISYIEAKASKNLESAEKTKLQIKHAEEEQYRLSEEIKEKKWQLQGHKQLEPKWYIMILSIIFRLPIYKNWQAEYSDLLSELKIILSDHTNLAKEIANLKRNQQNAEHDGRQYSSQLSTLERDFLDLTNYLQNCEFNWHSSEPNNEFWDMPEDKLQLTSPWIFAELQETRAQLFIDALNLQKAFIINCRNQITNNLKSIKFAISGGNWPPEKESMLKHLWASLFIVVPTISTTFASFSKLFDGCGKDSIGYLLVDEAGQAAPQSAVGALFRSKRAIIVGDPLQIQPVVTIPEALNKCLLSYFGLSSKWDAREQSIQTLADRVNPYGTMTLIENVMQWIGCPLRVHRRCLEPMFSVANEIAYNNLMIQATNSQQSAIERIFPTSLWFDVSVNKFDNNWSEYEGQVTLNLIVDIISANRDIPSLYIISPYKNVADQMRKFINGNLRTLFSCVPERKEPELLEWLNKSVGTIHTFQGKQSDAVILLLGGDPKKPGTIDWAAEYPNLLNVAITRAKNLVFVVGNYEVWSVKNNFMQLSKKLTRVMPNKVLKSAMKTSDSQANLTNQDRLTVKI